MSSLKLPYRTGVLFACLSLTFASCIPEPSGTTGPEFRGTIDFSKYEQEMDELPGTWDWIRTTRFETIDGIPETDTPISTGIRKILLITENQEIEIVQDDTIRTTEPLESFLHNVEWGIRGDTLATRSNSNDRPENVYLRLTDE